MRIAHESTARASRRIRLWSLAAGGEKRLHYGGAFWREDAEFDLDSMIQCGMIEDLQARAHGATFGIIGAIHQASDARLNHCARAHGARFDRDVERRTDEAVIAEGARRGTQGHDFSVRGGIGVSDGAIGGLRDEAAFEHDYGADGNFTGSGCGARLI